MTQFHPISLVWEFSWKAQFPHSFGRIARNSTDTVCFPKISAPRNNVKLRCFKQCTVILPKFLVLKMCLEQNFRPINVDKIMLFYAVWNEIVMITVRSNRHYCLSGNTINLSVNWYTLFYTFLPIIVRSRIKFVSSIQDVYCTKNYFQSYYFTAQKMKFSFKDFLSKCDHIRSFVRIWSHL